ncbi:MAG TPA: serine/threonine-protein kinase, partial [Nocardioides sp.]|nr:serine/threonine-protein kinase [Nocardioides sp.]
MSLPTRLGRLERVDRLGSGGFATVWLYHDAELDSDVAVKALAENWSQRLDVRERFLEEARILRRADSDHIVRVYDIGEVDGTPYFVMTYADHGSLARHLEPGVPMPVPRVVDLVSQAGAGLAVLHEHGVVHRDIKPQNLLLRSGGSAGDRLLVADLGVAKAMLHASGLTQVVGTPAYMAPEQATGGGIDVRADVHALAAVTYQMLTGRLARDGTIADLAHATLPVAPSRLVPA